MILYRYINRQVFVTTIVVTFILVMVLVTGRFIQYLADAATGRLAADALFIIMAFRLPEFLQMIVPLGLYLSILMVLGRMYMDNEMVVLQSGGQGNGRVVRSLKLPLTMATALIALFAFYVTPHGDAEVARIIDEQRNRSALELLSPGRFHARGAGGTQRATYAESLNRQEGVLENVFLADARFREQEAGRIVTVRARSGRLVELDGISYLELADGVQYQGTPGDMGYQTIEFEEALVRIGEASASMSPPKVRAWSTPELWHARHDDNEAYAELQWRLSLVMIVPLMGLAAVPLSRVNPRQGRFFKMIPAILGYMLYVGLLLTTRSQMADHDGPLPPHLNMLWLHLIAALIVMMLFWPPRLKRRRAS